METFGGAVNYGENDDNQQRSCGNGGNAVNGGKGENGARGERWERAWSVPTRSVKWR